MGWQMAAVEAAHPPPRDGTQPLRTSTQFLRRVFGDTFVKQHDVRILGREEAGMRSVRAQTGKVTRGNAEFTSVSEN